MPTRESMPIYRHYKTGGIYELVAEGLLESSPTTQVVIYRNIETRQVWVRDRDEFFGKTVQDNNLVPRFVRVQ